MTWFACQGSDADFAYYKTPSRSRSRLEHDVIVDKRSGHVSCTCEDSQYRKLGADILDATAPHGCWHVRCFCATVGKILARAIGAKP